ncbi:MAG: NAD(P)-dependent alcohol dehydrogenase, partial [Kamptonema sp. SIO4C4]|nr:NAD(P)-dependent alcohol dehydrogenase [Kamptonema sp. SIO4C4]
MKAVTIAQYGSPDVLQYQDVETPQATGDRLLVRVKASSVNPIDWKIRAGYLKLLTGRQFPLYLGLDVSGVVEAVGETVTRFQPGDEIYACLEVKPKQAGTYAEYTTVPEFLAAHKPTNLSHLETATVPLAAMTALQALRNQGKVQSGQQVLINGASGGVGSFAVQIAKTLGAQVTGVCSTRNLETVRSLGADQVIDYTQTDFTQNASPYHCIFDTVAKRSFWDCRRVLTPQGHYITTLPMPDTLILGAIGKLLPWQKAHTIILQPKASDLETLKTWIEAGKIRPLIDRTFPLTEI